MSSSLKLLTALPLTTLLNTLLVLPPAGLVQAELNFYLNLTANATCQSTSGNIKPCEPKEGLCAYGDLIGVSYCCDASDPICYAWSNGCQGDDDGPDDTQIRCGGGEDGFCCAKRYQKCTERIGQINICWSDTDNPYYDVTAEKAQKTLNDSKSADPDASTTSVDIVKLVSSTATPEPSSSATSAASRASAQEDGQGNGEDDGGALSGGAIAGIVIGSLAGGIIIAVIGFFIWRRLRPGTSSGTNTAGDYSAVQKSEGGDYTSGGAETPYMYGGYDEKSTVAPSSFMGPTSPPSEMTAVNPNTNAQGQRQMYEVEGTVVAHEVPGNNTR
ncbi:MAG: hypothetical protein M1831_006065 [Alyxoria varia]|nr:MAG: hypothetical protein M1831_006065 [Alyxoria varia]